MPLFFIICSGFKSIFATILYISQADKQNKH